MGHTAVCICIGLIYIKIRPGGRWSEALQTVLQGRGYCKPKNGGHCTRCDILTYRDVACLYITQHTIPVLVLFEYACIVSVKTPGRTDQCEVCTGIVYPQ